MAAFRGMGVVRAALAAAALLVGTVALAGGAGAVRKQIESSMLVSGKIRVDTEGKVTGYSLDQQGKLPSGIVGMLARAVPSWKFKPVVVDGRTVNASTSMTIRLVAKKLDADNYTLQIRSASFGDQDGITEEDVRPIHLMAPAYPNAAQNAGVTGTTYLLIKVGRDGKVIDVFTEQVNLKVVASDGEMTQWRKLLAASSMRTARTWTFTPPTRGKAAANEFWVVRVPVVYSFDTSRTRYGVWEAYVPGPRQRNPWSDEDEGVAFSPDTLAPGGSYLAGAGLKLMTDPSQG